MDIETQVFYEYLCQLEKNPQQANIDESKIQAERLPILKKVLKLVKYIEEINSISEEIATGNFDQPVAKDNPFAGPVKELQSVLQHLSWQITEVARGDFTQSIDYLGDLSASFNQMIAQLKKREDTLKENMRLQEENLAFRARLLEQELDNQKVKYNQFSESVKELRSYRHDMKNHLLCIASLLDADDKEEAQKYIHSMLSIFHSQSVHDYNDNYMLGALLSEKTKAAYENHIQVTKHIEIHRKLKIENPDWCILLGNALDNAMEALRQVTLERRRLDIQIRNVNDMLLVRITNEHNNVLVQEDDLFKTTKDNDHLHGIGLKNIKKCVEKYQGDLTIETTDSKFILTAVLCNI